MHPLNATLTRLPRILVVDDMPDNLFLMNGLLEDRYDVVQAASGREALQVVMSNAPPDMVLLDIMMPDMDGYEVLRRIRQHTPTATIPIIFLTALAGIQDERLGIDLGAIDYLTKPVDPELVMRRVDAHVNATTRTRRVEALAGKLARFLSPHAWDHLFNGVALEALRFEQRQQTVLYVDAPGLASLNLHGRDSFIAEVEWLAMRHLGRVDHYADGAAVVMFDEPAACVRMAMALQRCSQELQLHMGIHTGICEIGIFRNGPYQSCTLIGQEASFAAKVAATAATGSVAVSPETYALVRDDIQADPGSCLLMEEFQDSDLAQVSLTPAPVRGEHVMSTFAGLGS